LQNICFWFTPLGALFKSVEQKKPIEKTTLFKSVEQNNRFKKCTQWASPKNSTLQEASQKKKNYKGKNKTFLCIDGAKFVHKCFLSNHMSQRYFVKLLKE
jgi:hypothetical protein